MRPRHRIPSVFSLSMVDVFCCALGSVLLLLLYGQFKTKEAEKKATAEETANRELNERLKKFLEDNKDLLAKLKKTEGQLNSSEIDRKALEAWLAAADQRIAGLDSELLDLLKKNKDLTTNKETLASQLLNKDVDLNKLKAALKAAQDDAKGLQDKVNGLDAELVALLKKNKDITSSLADLKKQLDSKDVSLKELLLALKSAKEKAEQDVKDALKSADNRFAGIDLKGDIRRVVFVVDMSGSMVLVENDKDYRPEKWAAVRDTVVKLMTSLPRLEKYQLIVFSDRYQFLLGGKGKWLDYDRDATPGQVQKALTDLKPEGGTNMYDAFEAAFKYRADGLDTVFFLSDGIPNLPLPSENRAGLTPADSRLTELQQGEKLGKYLRNKLKTDWNRPIDGKRVTINACGFYYESPDLGAFLWGLARDNQGSFVGMSKP
jgi:hypothetical protein